MAIVDVNGNPINTGRKIRVIGGPLDGTILTEKRPDVRCARIPIRDEGGKIRWMLHEKDASGLRFTGWSADGEHVTWPAGTDGCRSVTQQYNALCSSSGVTMRARAAAVRDEDAKPLTPADLGPYSPDDVWGEDPIKDWEPPAPTADDDLDLPLADDEEDGS